MKKIIFLIFFIFSINLFGMEEVELQEDMFEDLISIASTILYAIVIASPPITIGAGFALMRYDKEVKMFLEEELSQIDKEIEELIENEAVNIDINREADILQQQIAALERKLERI